MCRGTFPSTQTGFKRLCLAGLKLQPKLQKEGSSLPETRCFCKRNNSWYKEDARGWRLARTNMFSWSAEFPWVVWILFQIHEECFTFGLNCLKVDSKRSLFSVGRKRRGGLVEVENCSVETSVLETSRLTHRVYFRHSCQFSGFLSPSVTRTNWRR